ncbi:hypothetical protein OKW21_006471 [Catalinimonas alkaloidigena]|uniref:DUF547 domain-containing protein n=1 Tax=Catalinimonas alkaloidigena TaxID=1075417 RepID=UPI0024052AF6|nr:DUF547 domain-containing protein [Catalinimonas alkaloidigena]MDF9801208.1 hypothetical protein [Catalinimonas alkaloidigena]
MKHLFVFFAYFALTPANALNITDFTQEADQFFGSYVEHGLVDYQAVKQNMEEVEALYQQIAKMSAQRMADAEKKAFYINAYNLIVIRQIAENYPVSSPMKIDGFFDQQKHKVAGEMLTLNELEKQKLLQPYKDARIHFALVCAAQSCPPLPQHAVQADRLDEQMNQLTKKALNNNDFIRLKSGQKEVAVSKIFEWYKDDFKQEASSVLAYINTYRKEKIPSSYELSYYEYDWALNEL